MIKLGGYSQGMTGTSIGIESIEHQRMRPAFCARGMGNRKLLAANPYGIPTRLGEKPAKLTA